MRNEPTIFTIKIGKGSASTAKYLSKAPVEAPMIIERQSKKICGIDKILAGRLPRHFVARNDVRGNNSGQS